MSALGDFAEYFKARKVRIRRWYEDGVGRFAFRIRIDGQDFVCVSRKTAPKNGRTSIMARVAGKAQTTDALIALRLRDRTLVFDPITVLAHGEAEEPREDDRKERGEKWVRVALDLGCEFDEWYDGTAEPARFGDVVEA